MKTDKLHSDKVTISDVARLAGVVPSTVSHVLNGTASISPSTKERVLRAVEELNYSPNALARALRQKRTRLIGVVMQDVSTEFYAHCAASMLEEARKDKSVILLCDAAFDKNNKKDGVAALIERRVDGLVFIGGGNDGDIIKEVRKANIPLVLGDRSHESLYCVQFDNETTVNRLVHALYDSGYRRFIYLGESLDIQSNLRERFRGFQKGVEECGIPERNVKVILDDALEIYKIRNSYQIYDNHFKDFKRSLEEPAVVITSNDLIAQGFVAAVLRHGLKVPEDMAVVGFDNNTVSQYSCPALTTVEQDEKALGRSCYAALKELIDGKKLKQPPMLPQRIIARETAVIPEEILEKYQPVSEPPAADASSAHGFLAKEGSEQSKKEE